MNSGAKHAILLVENDADSCTALTQLGMEPPLIDVWDFGFHEHRLVETPPTVIAET